MLPLPIFNEYLGTSMPLAHPIPFCLLIRWCCEVVIINFVYCTYNIEIMH